jgi:hypothetical protein
MRAAFPSWARCHDAGTPPLMRSASRISSVKPTSVREYETNMRSESVRTRLGFVSSDAHYAHNPPTPIHHPAPVILPMP